jgi:hypothetical protein
VPERQVSPDVHALLSLQDAPSAFGVGAGQPVAGTHVPGVKQVFETVQVIAAPEQTPA